MRRFFETLFGVGELTNGELKAQLEAMVRKGLASDARSYGRTTDGVEFVRWVERGPTRAQLCGKIWELPDSGLHTFWLLVEREREGPRWTLYYDVDPTSTSRRFERDAADLLKSPHEVRWLIRLAGE